MCTVCGWHGYTYKTLLLAVKRYLEELYEKVCAPLADCSCNRRNSISIYCKQARPYDYSIRSADNERLYD